LEWKKINLTQQKHAFTDQKKCTTTRCKHKKLKPGLVAFTTSGLETEWVYSRRNREVREEISKEKVEKKE